MPDSNMPALERLMTPGEVAEVFHVHPKTVTRWARQGKLNAKWTPGGHRRFREDDVREILNGSRS